MEIKTLLDDISIVVATSDLSRPNFRFYRRIPKELVEKHNFPCFVSSKFISDEFGVDITQNNLDDSDFSLNTLSSVANKLIKISQRINYKSPVDQDFEENFEKSFEENFKEFGFKFHINHAMIMANVVRYKNVLESIVFEPESELYFAQYDKSLTHQLRPDPQKVARAGHLFLLRALNEDRRKIDLNNAKNIYLIVAKILKEPWSNTIETFVNNEKLYKLKVKNYTSAMMLYYHAKPHLEILEEYFKNN